MGRPSCFDSSPTGRAAGYFAGTWAGLGVWIGRSLRFGQVVGMGSRFRSGHWVGMGIDFARGQCPRAGGGVCTLF